MLIDDLYHRLVHRFRRSQHQDSNESDERPYTRSQRSKGGRYKHGVLNNPRNFVMNQPAFIENVSMAEKSAFDPVFEYILPYTDPDAAVDSSARFPPPLCHPGTRLKIGSRLDEWLADSERKWKMIWLHGPAGTGKSAVAQTFAEHCVENDRLGASFFFSRPNKRNNPDVVIPSLIYQLAVQNLNYKTLVTGQLASDPHLMRKARHIQFRRLIVEPFSHLQTQRQKRIQKPLLVILDGLDECSGENSQRELIEMISGAMQLNQGLPLLWLICSRPEAHLKYIFSRPDYTVNCGREELVIDAESIADVDLYIHDGLAGIRARFGDVTSPIWPPREQIVELSTKASGHFGFASTALRYIGDETSATPTARFDHLLSFLGGDKAEVSENPLEALDALYAGILRDIPDDVLHLTKQILCHYTFISGEQFTRFSAQVLCNFLCMDQTAFYTALRKLHSMIDVPEPGAALQRPLHYYHASFSDYLCDPHRSGNFIIKSDAWLDTAKLYLTWYKADLVHFHTSDGFEADDHEHGPLPGLKWASEGSEAEISKQILREVAKNWCWWTCNKIAEWSDDLLSEIQNFDFRHISQGSLGYEWVKFLNKLWEVDSSSGFIRTEPQNEIDLLLLEYMKVTTESVGPIKPARFPLGVEKITYGDYFLLGQGSTTVVCWTTGLWGPQFVVQNCDKPPSKERVAAYLAALKGSD